MPAFADQDQSMVNLNTAMLGILEQYLPEPNSDFSIRFDLPVDNALPEKPTVYVFLYKVHENLEVRSSLLPYAQPDGRLNSRRVHIRFAYLITYWGPAEGTDNAGLPGSDMMKINNSLLNALVNNRTLANFPGSITEVIPPEEGLNSLGNFWQSLGNKPRLAFGYAVTLSVGLTARTGGVALVRSTTLGVGNKPAGDVPALVAQRLAARVLATVQGSGALTELERAQLARLEYTCAVLAPAADSEPGTQVNVVVTGALDQATWKTVSDEITTWPGATDLGELDGAPFTVDAVDITRLRNVDDTDPATRGRLQ